jgi:hypothetical protein
MRSSSEYRRIAREALKGRYFQMVGIALIAAILGGGILIAVCFFRMIYFAQESYTSGR